MAWVSRHAQDWLRRALADLELGACPQSRVACLPGQAQPVVVSKVVKNLGMMIEQQFLVEQKLRSEDLDAAF